MQNNRSIIILRGLPGSGKSTLADILSGGQFPVFSVDDYFTDKQGNYQFVFSDNHLAYKHCEQNVRNAMESHVEKIFLANTFTMDWEIEPYFKMAKEYNYQVFVVTVENYHGGKNIHEIPYDHIEKMALKYKIKLH